MPTEENQVTLQEAFEGEVRIADEVIAQIAGIAAMEVEGVDSMEGNITRELIGKLGRSKLSKGVTVEVAEDRVNVVLTLNLKYGYRVMDVSKAVQERVATSINNMTGFEVINVTVNVAGISMEKKA